MLLTARRTCPTLAVCLTAHPTAQAIRIGLPIRVFLESIGEAPKTEPPVERKKNPAAALFRRLGGLKVTETQITPGAHAYAIAIRLVVPHAQCIDICRHRDSVVVASICSPFPLTFNPLDHTENAR